jgi:hypothetical protein
MPWSNPLPKLLDLSMINMTLGIFDIIRSYYIPACCAFKDNAQNDADFAQNNDLKRAFLLDKSVFFWYKTSNL